MELEAHLAVQVARTHAENGCKYAAAIIRDPSTKEEQRVVWATGAGLHSEIYSALEQSVLETGHGMKPDGGGLLKISDSRKVVYVYGVSADYGPDMYLRHTVTLLEKEFPGYHILLRAP